MSNSSDYGSLSIYVRELGGSVSIDLNPYADSEWEEEQRERGERIARLESPGSIPLFAGSSLSYIELDKRGISPEHWQWGAYQAERYLRHYDSWLRLEPLFVRQLHSVGRSYAIRRYAKFERLPIAAAMTAALPHGASALLHEYFVSEGLQSAPALSQRIYAILRRGLENPDATAYSKTTCVQAEIHAIATEAWGGSADMTLSRRKTRQILALSRLHFSVAESKGSSLRKLAQLEEMYATERERLCRDGPAYLHPFARFIRNWHVQHVWALTAYYPISIRHAFDRGNRHLKMNSGNAERELTVNELALVFCSTSKIEQTAREKGPRKAEADQTLPW